MDKLKPLITHKFWIILFIALLLPVIGWSMATGSLAKEIEERKSAIDQAFTDAQVSPNPPNQTWSTALKQINDEKRKYNAESTKYLWEKQKELFVWPPDITPLMQNTPYRGEISNVPRNLYRTAYKFELLRAHKLANPYSLKDGTGLVDLSPNTIPHVPLDKWKNVSPTSEDMWDAQEDVWLITSILEAIAKVNKDSGATNISESPIRQISVLELRGGTVGDDGSAPAGDGGMGMDGEMAAAGGGGLFSGGGGGGGMGGMAGGKEGSLSIEVDMDLVKIFGNDVDGSAGGGDGGSEMPMEESALGGGFGGGMGGAGSQKLKRYYNEEEDLPYKTRAFYLKATIQSSKLPNLLAQLSSMPWPTKIVRVQRADLFDDHMNPIAAGGGGGGGMGRRGGAGGAAGGFSSESDFAGGGGGFGPPGGGFESDMGVNGAGRLQGQENKGLLDAALNDPELAVVTIAGLMTLYKPYVPPEGEVVAESTEQPQGATEPTEPAASTEPADGSAPAASTPEAAAAGGNPGTPAQPAATTPENSPPQPGGNTTTPAEPATPSPAAASNPSETTQPPPAEPKPEKPVNP